MHSVQSLISLGARVRVRGTTCPIMDVTGSPHQIVMIAYFSFVSAFTTQSFSQPSLNILCAMNFYEQWICQIIYLKKFQITFSSNYEPPPPNSIPCSVGSALSRAYHYATACELFRKCDIACVNCFELFSIDYYLVRNRINDQVARIYSHYATIDYKKHCARYFRFVLTSWTLVTERTWLICTVCLPWESIGGIFSDRSQHMHWAKFVFTVSVEYCLFTYENLAR